MDEIERLTESSGAAGRAARRPHLAELKHRARTRRRARVGVSTSATVLALVAVVPFVDRGEGPVPPVPSVSDAASTSPVPTRTTAQAVVPATAGAVTSVALAGKESTVYALYGRCPDGVRSCAPRVYSSRDLGRTWSTPVTLPVATYPSLATSADGTGVAVVGVDGTEPWVPTGDQRWANVQRGNMVAPGNVRLASSVILGTGLYPDPSNGLDVVDPAHWTVHGVTVSPPYDRSSSGIQSDGSVLTAALTGKTAVSTDAGATWVRVPRAEGEIGSSTQRSPDGALVSVSGGDGAGWVPLIHIYRSTDDGVTWRSRTLARQPVLAMDTLRAIRGGYLAAGTDGGLYHASVDGPFVPVDGWSGERPEVVGSNARALWSLTMNGTAKYALASDPLDWHPLPLPE